MSRGGNLHVLPADERGADVRPVQRTTIRIIFEVAIRPGVGLRDKLQGFDAIKQVVGAGVFEHGNLRARSPESYGVVAARLWQRLIVRAPASASASEPALSRPRDSGAASWVERYMGIIAAGSAVFGVS
jgi:hypothetical protein